MRSPCVRCGMPLLVGEGIQVTVTFTPDELAQAAVEVSDARVEERLLCALGLVDPQLERETRAAIRDALVINHEGERE